MTGLVLAGGRSTRMGQDKALIRYRGKALIDRAIGVLDGCCTEVLVSSGDGRRLDRGRPQVADVIPDGGPLAGIVAGLEAASHPLVAVLAVDLADASAAVFRTLAGRWRGEAAVVPRAAGRLQPLHAVWAASSAPALRTRLTDGLCGVTAAVETLGAAIVDIQDGRFARNLNAPDDLQ